MIKTDAEVGEISLMRVTHLRYHCFRRNPQLLRFKHDGGAVCVIGADKMTVVTTHLLETHPNIGLNVT